MDAHNKEINYINFYPGANKPYLVTTGDNKTVKVWDYLSKSCVWMMEGTLTMFPLLCSIQIYLSLLEFPRKEQDWDERCWELDNWGIGRVAKLWEEQM